MTDADGNPRYIIATPPAGYNARFHQRSRRALINRLRTRMLMLWFRQSLGLRGPFHILSTPKLTAIIRDFWSNFWNPISLPLTGGLHRLGRLASIALEAKIPLTQ